MLLSSAMRSGGELWLPEPAIERIQDFLNTIEAAQTMILSKSWYNVWLLRPNLVFDHGDHIASYYSHISDQIYHEEMKQFLEFADTALNKLEESNLKIQSFKLCMNTERLGEYDVSHTELILRALKIGATHLSFHLRYGFGFVLPDEVFESAETLTLIKCNINPKPQLLTCSKLLSLRLDGIEFKNPDTISHILFSSPLMQKLSLHHLSMVKPDDFLPSLDGAGYYDNYPANDIGYITKPLMCLTTLVLKYVYFDMLFLGDFSSKFPLLKDLTLFMSLKKYQDEIRISSNSLERLYFKLNNRRTHTRYNHPYKRQRVTLDFPSIRKFTYVGSVIPLLSLESNSRGYWESHLSITRREKCLTTSWFCRLSDFLTKLRRSRVSLSLRVRSVTGNFDYEVGDIQGLPTSEIENLIIDHQELTPLTCYALLDGLFRICHPKLITQSVAKCFCVKIKHIELLGQILLNGVLMHHGKIMLTSSQFMYGLNDLKDATAQIIDHNKATVSTQSDVYVPLDALSQHLKSAKGKQEVRFQLSWQPTTTTRKKFYLKILSNQKIEELENDQVRNPDVEKGLSKIEYAKDVGYHLFIVCNMKFIENSFGSGDFVGKIKHILKLLKNGLPESGNKVDDANKFSSLLYEVFQEPYFVNVVRSTIENEDYSSLLVYYAELLSNNYSPTERVTHMKADWRFKHTLMSTNLNTIIRVFLSILFGHWSDEGELRELDKRMGKHHFGNIFDSRVAGFKLFSPLDLRYTPRY